MSIFEKGISPMSGEDPEKIAKANSLLKGEEKTQRREKALAQTVEGVKEILEKDKKENQDRRMAV